MKISIVLPVHNEYENLELLLIEWSSELNLLSNIFYEFVLVEDGSTDGTKDLIKKLERTSFSVDVKKLSDDMGLIFAIKSTD